MSEYKDIIVNKFTEDSARKFREDVIARAVIDPQSPIIVYIDSYGGYIDSLNNMLETIEQVSNLIITVCQGKAMSCGAVLLAAGDHRFCGRHSRVMVHQGSSGTDGPIEGLQNDVHEAKRLNKKFMELMADRCGLSFKGFKDEMTKRLHTDDDEARDMYLPAEDALDLGIIDYIGMPHIKPHVSYEILVAPKKTYPKKEVEKKVEKKVKKQVKKQVKKKAKRSTKRKRNYL